MYSSKRHSLRNRVQKIAHSVTAFALFVCAAIGVASITTSPVLAEDLGSPAIVIEASTLTSGPGTAYPSTGTLSAEQEVIVTRCSGLYCLIDSAGGWVKKAHLSFGGHAHGPLRGENFGIGRGDGEVCFYDGPGFTGTYYCQPAGSVVRDLILTDWDNRISSISIEGEVSVHFCRDRGFVSYCELIIEDASSLHPLLNNAASSYHISSVPDLTVENSTTGTSSPPAPAPA